MWGLRKWQLKGTGFFWGWWDVLKLDCDGCTSPWIYFNHWIVHFKWETCMACVFYLTNAVTIRNMIFRNTGILKIDTVIAKRWICSWIGRLDFISFVSTKIPLRQRKTENYGILFWHNVIKLQICKVIIHWYGCFHFRNARIRVGQLTV